MTPSLKNLSTLSLTALISLGALSTAACSSDEANPNGSTDDDGGSSNDLPSTGTGGGSSASGGASNGSSGGSSASGGTAMGSGGTAMGSGGVSAGTGGTGDPGGDLSACDDAALVWKSGHKTNYTSYPDPGSEECIVYNGCMWAGWFAGCDNQQSEEWVEATNIAAVFPGFNELSGHQICVRSGAKTMIVNVLDTCGDSDCDGCCTQNKGDKDALIDLESYTNARWGLPDGTVQWADLGPVPTPCQ